MVRYLTVGLLQDRSSSVQVKRYNGRESVHCSNPPYLFSEWDVEVAAASQTFTTANHNIIDPDIACLWALR
jgi:hypothetical protein